MENKIHSYMHCGRCLAELPPNESAESYARLSIGATKDGIQVWCVRHNRHVGHFLLKKPLTPTCDACEAGIPHIH